MNPNRTPIARPSRLEQRAGAAVAADSFRTDLAVEGKSGKTDVVTQVDRDAQVTVIETIREAFPDDPIVGEEKTR